MSNADVPIWEKYTLTIDEAAKYFRIGEKKLRKSVVIHKVHLSIQSIHFR